MEKETLLELCSKSGIELKEYYLYIQWCIGGVDGGSCWENSCNRHFGPDPEPEFHDLDELLSRINPRLTFLQYKKLMTEVMVTGKYTEDEYYGNYNDYKYHEVNLLKLFEFLKENDESSK